MLQLLLAVLAVTLISVSGWGLVEQVHLQQMVSDQRETGRRLDVAVEAIQGKLTAMPGRDGLFAPAPVTPNGGWSQIPAGIGGINTNTAGVPFLYCPVVVAPDGSAQPAGEDNGVVEMPSGGVHYGIQVQNGLVIGSDADVPNGSSGTPNLAAFSPVAFLVAAKPGSSAPPRCDAIGVVDGHPHVDGGLVRVVSRPGGTLAQNAAAKEVSNLYTAPGATGTGRYPNDPAGIDDALGQIARYRPGTMTLHVAGVVTPSAAAWNGFVSSLDGNGSSLTIVGDVPGSGIAGVGGQMPAPGRLVLQNIGIPVQVVVGTNASLNLVGNILLGDRGVFAAGAQSVSSAPGASVVTSTGNCWASASGDVTFAYSGPGNSVVPANPAFTMQRPARANYQDDESYQDAVAAYDQAYDGWRDTVTGLEQARQTNHSSFSCGTASS